MTNSMRNPPCTRCRHRLGKSCCEVDGDGQLATLTLSDVLRVSEHTGVAATRFSEEEWLTVEEAHGYETRRPVYAGYFRRSSARLTLRRKGNACIFLHPDAGCRLPQEVRPLACRLYPFEVWPDGHVSLLVGKWGDGKEAAPLGEACLAIEEAESLSQLFAFFSLTREKLRQLYVQLRSEVQAHGRGKSAPPSG